MSDLTTGNGTPTQAVAPVPNALQAMRDARNKLLSEDEAFQAIPDEKLVLSFFRVASYVKEATEAMRAGSVSENPLWQPAFLEISSDKKKEEKAQIAEKHGAGVIFDWETGRVFKDGLRVFPLMQTRENSLFASGGLACKSIDGERGETIRDVDSAQLNRELQKLNLPFRYTDATRGTVHACGSASCPNPGYYAKVGDSDTFTKKPELFKSIPQKSCQAGTALFVVTEDFSDIFLVPVKHFSLDGTVKVFSKALRNPLLGIEYDAQTPGATWWDLGTKEDGRGDNKAWYYKASAASANKMSSHQSVAVTQLQLLLKDWHTARKEVRERKDVGTTDPSRTIDVTAVEAAAAAPKPPKPKSAGPSFVDV